MASHATFSFPDSLPGRALAPLPSTVLEHHRFIIGSCSLSSKLNQLAVVDFVESESRIDLMHSTSLGSAEVLALDSLGPFVAVALADNMQEKIILYKVNEEVKIASGSVHSDEENKEEVIVTMQELGTISHESLKDIAEVRLLQKEAPSKAPVSKQPQGSEGPEGPEVGDDPTIESILIVDREGIKMWDAGQVSKSPAQPVITKPVGRCHKCRLYPHGKYLATVLHDKGVVASYDLKASDIKPAWILERGHKGGGTCDLDFNPNKLYTMATSGKDAAIKLWDVRKLEPRTLQPLNILLGHSHWVSAVEYNQSYDQLLLSGSSSTEVCLWRAITQSSQDPSLSKQGLISNTYLEEERDTVLSTTELDDSVYSVRWSKQEPWIYAALAYSGQLLVAHIPYEEKYKIMIQVA